MSENKIPFVGKVEKITLVSMPCFYICPPKVGEDDEQKLTINKNGKVTFTSKFYQVLGICPMSYGRWGKTTLDKDTTFELLEAIVRPFREPYIETFCTDVGSWHLVAFNTEGQKFEFDGCLMCDSFEGAEELSYHIRQTLMMPDLFAFDGGYGINSTDYIYLSVEFSHGGQTYYYRTDDDSVSEGDVVIVPVGDGTEKKARVIDVECFKEDNVPMPLEEVKYILRKL